MKSEATFPLYTLPGTREGTRHGRPAPQSSSMVWHAPLSLEKEGKLLLGLRGYI